MDNCGDPPEAEKGYRWMDECRGIHGGDGSGWMEGWMNGWMDEWMDR
jgi:hypothetical protein